VSLEKEIPKNLIILYFGTIVSNFLNVFYYYKLVNYLEPVEYGILSFGLTYAVIFEFFSDTGLRYLVTREVSKNRNLVDYYFINTVFSKLILIISNFIISFPILIFIIDSKIKIIVSLVLIISIYINSFIELFLGIFRAFGKFYIQALVTFTKNFLIFFIALFLIITNQSLIMFAINYLITNLIVNIAVYMIFYKKILNSSIKININFSFIINNFKAALPMGIARNLNTVYYWIDIIFLSLFVSDAATAWYNTANSLMLNVLLISISLNMVIFPIMSRFSAVSLYDLKKLFQNIIRYTFILSFPIGVGTTLLANEIIYVLFKEKYLNSVVFLQILSWVIVVLFFKSILGRLFEVLNMQKRYAIIIVISIPLNIITSIIFYLCIGYTGICIGSLISETIILLIMYFSAPITLSKKTLISALKSIISSILMGILLILLKILFPLSNILYLILVIFIAIFFYFTMNIILKNYSNYEKNVIKSIFIKKKEYYYKKKNNTKNGRCD